MAILSSELNPKALSKNKKQQFSKNSPLVPTGNKGLKVDTSENTANTKINQPQAFVQANVGTQPSTVGQLSVPINPA